MVSNQSDVFDLLVAEELEKVPHNPHIIGNKDCIANWFGAEDHKARVEGLLEPEAVKRIRKRLNLTQKDAGRLIGGGANAFQKYESGDIVVSHAVMSALLLLDRDPSGLSLLRQRVRQKEAA